MRKDKKTEGIWALLKLIKMPSIVLVSLLLYNINIVVVEGAWEYWVYKNGWS